MAGICNRSYGTVKMFLSQSTTNCNLASIMASLGGEGRVKMSENSVTTLGSITTQRSCV